MKKPVDTKYWRIREDLKLLLNRHLPGGRGFQRDLDKSIHRLAAELITYGTPER